MMRRAAAVLFTVTFAVSVAGGGIYVTDSRFVGSLTIDGRTLSKTEGRATAGGWSLGPWSLSAPTLKTEKGEYLAYDLDGKNLGVRFASKSGEDTAWVFHIVRKIKPEENKSRQRAAKEGDKLLEGDEGYLFHLSARNGPREGWFLGVEAKEPEKDEEPRLILVKDGKDAATLTYMETRHQVRPAK